MIGAVTGARSLPISNGIAEYEVPRDTPFSQILRRLVEVEAIAHFEAVEPSLHDIYIHTVGDEETS